jgi:hypothetical protein
MKAIEDVKRRDVTFHIGYGGRYVYDHLCPYRRVTVPGQPHYNKVLKQFIDLFQVLECSGTTTYHLNLPRL